MTHLSVKTLRRYHGLKRPLKGEKEPLPDARLAGPVDNTCPTSWHPKDILEAFHSAYTH